jgi:hypothetical protein
VDAGEQAVQAQVVQVAADRLRRHRELGGQILDLDPPAAPRPVQDFHLPVAEVHGGPVFAARSNMSAFIRKSNISLDPLTVFK